MTFQPALLEDNSIITEMIFSWFLQNSKIDYCQVCARRLKCKFISSDRKTVIDEKICQDGIYKYFKSGLWRDKLTKQIEQLKNIRKYLGITQAELARELGVSAVTLIHWERGIELPNRKYHTRLNEFCSRYKDKAEEYLKFNKERNAFGSKVYQVRKLLRLTQAELSLRLGLYRNAVHRWEKGISKPSFETIASFRKFCVNNGIDYESSDKTDNIEFNKLNFNEQLRYVRLKLAITQTEMSKLLNIDLHTISRWECGVETPSKRNYNKFFEFCKSKNLLQGKKED